MPVSKTAEKEMRVAERRHLRNKADKTSVKSKLTKVAQLISAGDAAQARKAAVEAASALDRAAVKGKLHPNNAARHKARMDKKINKLATAAPVETKAKK